MDRAILNGVVERNPIFGLAEKTEVFVINGRVYYCDRTSPNAEIGEYRGKRVVEGPMIETLERMGEKNMQDLYENYQKRFLEKELGGAKKRADERLPPNYGKLVRFALNNVFPNLRKKKDIDLDNEGEDKTKKDNPQNNQLSDAFEQEIEKYVSDRIAELSSLKIKEKVIRDENKLASILLNSRVSRNSENNSLLLRVMGGYNFAVARGAVYTLSSVGRDYDLKINGEKFVLFNGFPITELTTEVSEDITRRLSIEALKEKLKDSEEFQKLRAERSDIDELCKKEKYHEQDFGFERSGNQLLLYIDVPKHVLMNSRTDNLYLFAENKIGIWVDYSRDGIQFRITSGPKPLLHFSGPFYFSNEDSIGICMGNYDHRFWQSMGKGKAFAKYLTDARNVVLHGYTPRAHPVRQLSDDYFGNRRIGKEQMDGLGLTVSNNIIPGGRN